MRYINNYRDTHILNKGLTEHEPCYLTIREQSRIVNYQIVNQGKTRVVELPNCFGIHTYLMILVANFLSSLNSLGN